MEADKEKRKTIKEHRVWWLGVKSVRLLRGFDSQRQSVVDLAPRALTTQETFYAWAQCRSIP